MSIVENAIQDCLKYPLAFCKFISANDAGATGAHQSGFYIPIDCWNILFDAPGNKGENKDKLLTILWQHDFETDSRFIYYGKGTRNEYRITRFGKGFPFLSDDYVGDLFVLIQVSSDYYHAYIIDSDEEIEHFLSTVGLTAAQTNQLIETKRNLHFPSRIEEFFNEYIEGLQIDFPDTFTISQKAREFFHTLNGAHLTSPDRQLIKWLDMEFRLFKAIENHRYQERISTPFATVDELVNCANTLLNRRKSRAGKSLEHHLYEMFSNKQIRFDSQVITEGRRKPDFIFPGGEEYHDLHYKEDKLTFLGAKTTCKDRWRQILNEAERIPLKHLFTLQQGISENQLNEMYDHGVVLVVPKSYKSSFPSVFRDRILSLESFIAYVHNKTKD